MSHTTIVGEVGGTHEGDLGAAFALIDLSAEAGMDCAKFQWCSDPEALSRRRNAMDYVTHYRHLRFPEAWHGQLLAHCARRGIQYSCTAYLPKDIPIVGQYSAFLKVASFEATASDLLRAIKSQLVNDERQRLVVVSLGLGATKADVLKAMRDDENAIAQRMRFLACVSAYPTPLSEAEISLGRIRAEGLHGFSDHTAADDKASFEVGAMAVRAGATIIERHICLESCKPSNPDRVVSLGAHQLTEYVKRIRAAEQEPIKVHSKLTNEPAVSGPMPSEINNMRFRVGAEATEPLVEHKDHVDRDRRPR